MKNPSPKKINLQRKNRLSLNKSQIIFDPESRQRYIKGKKLLLTMKVNLTKI